MDGQWVVDSLIGFLQSPQWTSPINNFIDENCVVFDREDENKFSYTDVHNHYNKLVDQLLTQFSADLGITAEQLADACVESSTLGPVYQKPLEQVLAAEDFVLFKSHMVQRNVDLEFQALGLLQSQLGHAPNVYDPNAPPLPPLPAPVDVHLDEEETFQKALEESKREFETQKSLDEEAMQKLIDLATKESLQLFEASKKKQQCEIEQDMASLSVIPSNTTDVTATKQEKVTCSTSPKELQKSCLDVKNTTSEKQEESSKTQQAPLVSLSPEHTISSLISEAASEWVQSAKKEHEQALPQQTVSEKRPPDHQSREAYLKRQRDHLLKSKRQARAKELDQYNTTRAPVRKADSPISPQTPRSQSSATKPVTKPSEANEKDIYTGVLCSVIARKLKEEN